MKRLMVAVMVMGLIPALGSAQEKGKMGPVAPTKPKVVTPPTIGNIGSQPQYGGSTNGGAVKSFSKNNWRVEVEIGNGNGAAGGSGYGRGNDDNQYSRWDDRIENKVVRLERKVERLEDVIDYLLYVNEQGGRHHEDYLYRCSMSVCREQNAFFCDGGDYRTEVAIGTDRVKLFEELKRRGSAVYTDTFKCGEM